jgi:hypothetical protein
VAAIINGTLAIFVGITMLLAIVIGGVELWGIFRQLEPPPFEPRMAS